jgi:hypothetical protein
MSRRRMDWDKARLAGKPRLSVSTEREWRDQDRAAKWLAKAEQRRERRYVTARSTIHITHTRTYLKIARRSRSAINVG